MSNGEVILPTSDSLLFKELHVDIISNLQQEF